MPNGLQRVENKSRGNCGYYAYALSFMYFLKHSHGNIADYQGSLDLTKNQISQLQKIVNNKSTEFSKYHESVIQDILGPKLRKATVERTINEFIQSPLDSSTHAALNFKLRSRVKELLKDAYSSHAQAIEVARSRAGDYNAAELFHVEGLKDPIERYAQQIATEFKVKDSQNLSQQAVDQFFSDKTTHFFIDDEQRNLNIYAEHLSTDGVWAQEEQLVTLHRQVTGQVGVRNQETNKVEIRQERPIPLALYKDNTIASGNQLDSSRLGINLDNNTTAGHWTSLVYTSKGSYMKQKNHEATINYEKHRHNYDKNESKFKKLDIVEQLDHFEKQTNKEELKNLYKLAKDEIKNDKTHQVACLFFNRFKELEPEKSKQLNFDK